MSNISYKKCDRCGEQTAHSARELHQGYKITGWLTDAAFPVPTGHVSRMNLWGVKQGVDLCPDCVASYWNWWEAKKEKP